MYMIWYYLRQTGTLKRKKDQKDQNQHLGAQTGA